MAAPSNPDGEAVILRYEADNSGIAGYRYAFESSNGIAAEEQASLKTIDNENSFLVASGSFTYLGSDGVTYRVVYTADENGFHPVGDHLPVA